MPRKPFELHPEEKALMDRLSIRVQEDVMELLNKETELSRDTREDLASKCALALYEGFEQIARDSRR